MYTSSYLYIYIIFIYWIGGGKLLGCWLRCCRLNTKRGDENVKNSNDENDRHRNVEDDVENALPPNIFRGISNATFFRRSRIGIRNNQSLLLLVIPQ